DYMVGTRLITSSGDAALDGVYKLVAICKDDDWQPAMKISESPEKILNPGHKTAYRIYDNRGRASADLIALADETVNEDSDRILRHASRASMLRTVRSDDISRIEPLQETIIQDGKRVYPEHSIEDMREQRREDIDRLDPGVRRIVNPHIYHVSLSEKLWQLKQSILKDMRTK
ncbi:MAG: nicotinate phosphoribosyltransferase, partial [Chloroflexota bacterium]